MLVGTDPFETPSTEQSLVRGTRSAGHESRLDRSSPWGKGPSLIGTALYGAVRRVVWDPGANYSGDPIVLSSFFATALHE
jgi:hypothetical protein